MSRTWRRSKSGDAGGLKSARMPSTRLCPVHDRAREDLVRHRAELAVARRARSPSGSGDAAASMPAAGRCDLVSTSAPVRAAVPLPVRQTAMFLSGMSSAPTLQPRWSTQPCSSCAKSSVVSPPLASPCATPSSSSRSRSRVIRLRCRSPMLCCESSSRVRHSRAGRSRPCTSENGRASPRWLDSREMMPTQPSSTEQASRSMNTCAECSLSTASREALASAIRRRFPWTTCPAAGDAVRERRDRRSTRPARPCDRRSQWTGRAASAS